MSEYVVLAFLSHHRFMLDYAEQRREKRWEEVLQLPAEARQIGILGLGVLGRDALDKLKPLGFRLAGWSRSPKSIAGVTCFHGSGGLGEFLAGTAILVCLLPLTADTRGILNADALAKLPSGAAIINVGRGGHLIEQDLLAALASGQVRGATLDVFRTEERPRSRLNSSPSCASRITSSACTHTTLTTTPPA